MRMGKTISVTETIELFFYLIIKYFKLISRSQEKCSNSTPAQPFRRKCRAVSSFQQSHLYFYKYTSNTEVYISDHFSIVKTSPMQI